MARVAPALSRAPPDMGIELTSMSTLSILSAVLGRRPIA
jgi:hypothetical protein